MRDVILRALAHIEQQQNVKILYACESGSRAWGFESPDSDWDVRYVYLRPPNHYLTIDKGRDVLDDYKGMMKGHHEFDNKLLDITGWDLPKALQLLRKSNPQLGEWLSSPIVYTGTEQQSLRDLVIPHMHLFPAQEHYRSMAKSNFREFLQGPTVRYKKYLYVLRPLLAAQWVRIIKTFPPVDFNLLMYGVINTFYESQVDSLNLKLAISNLLDIKAQASEVDDGPQDPVLHRFIEQNIYRTDGITQEQREDPTHKFNLYFREMLTKYYPQPWI